MAEIRKMIFRAEDPGKIHKYSILDIHNFEYVCMFKVFKHILTESIDSYDYTINHYSEHFKSKRWYRNNLKTFL